MLKRQKALVKYYRRAFWRLLKKKGISSQTKIKKVKSANRNSLPNNYQQNAKRRIPTKSENEFLNIIQNTQHIHGPTPIKIKLSTPLQFIYPEKVIVRVSKNSNHLTYDQIDHTENNTIFLEVQRKQFLEGKFQSKTNVENEQYSISVPQMTLKQENYVQPEFVEKHFSFKNNGLYTVNLWHYKKQTLTTWHYDAHDNFLFQVKGTKQIQLIEPNSLKSIKINTNQNNSQNKNSYISCESVFGDDNNHRKQRPQDINLTKYEKQRSFKVKIKQNQCLFIPRGWFHKVMSTVNYEGDNIAINFWGNTIETYNLPKQQLQINLKQLIFQVSDQLCDHNVSDWIDLDQDMKEKFRKAYFFQYLNILSPQ